MCKRKTQKVQNGVNSWCHHTQRIYGEKSCFTHCIIMPMKAYLSLSEVSIKPVCFHTIFEDAKVFSKSLERYSGVCTNFFLIPNYSYIWFKNTWNRSHHTKIRNFCQIIMDEVESCLFSKCWNFFLL